MRKRVIIKRYMMVVMLLLGVEIQLIAQMFHMIETENLRDIFQKPRKGNRILSERLHGVSYG